MKILISGGRVIDPATHLDQVRDVLIEDTTISAIETPGTRTPADGVDRVLDARGLVVCPGFIDMHVHLREPGREDAETIATGTAAAAKGGFTSLCCMPNTTPPNDSQSVTEFIRDRARAEGLVTVYPIGAISKGLRGEELAEIGELARAGCVAVSDDGRPVMNAALMRRALEYASMFGLPLIAHEEDLHLAEKGVMHEGRVSTELGLRGIPPEAEAVMVARDILLTEQTGGRLHIAHVSTEASIRLLREAKARGVAVTGEATPHHFTLTDEAVRGFSPNTKMNPPLRSAEDVKAIHEALADGTIEVIATDHAPHTVQEKEQEFDYAPFGIVGLETALGLTITRLVLPGILTLPQAIAALTLHPARILGLPKGRLAAGADADITILDPAKTWTVDVTQFASRSRNSPFHDWTLTGEVVATLGRGRVVWERAA